MYNDKCIGGKHTDIRNLAKGFPRDLQEAVLDEALILRKEGWLIPKPASYGFHFSINPRVLKEIRELISKIDF